MAFLAGLACGAESWPGWRGLQFQGRSDETNVPVVWSSVTNIAWKTAIRGDGHSSPVVAGNSVFLTVAKSSPRVRVMGSASRAVLFVSVLLVALGTVSLLVRPERGGGLSLLSLALYGTVALAVVTVRHPLFCREGSAKWAWSVPFAGLCLVLAGVLAVGRRRAAAPVAAAQPDDTAVAVPPWQAVAGALLAAVGVTVGAVAWSLRDLAGGAGTMVCGWMPAVTAVCLGSFLALRARFGRSFRLGIAFRFAVPAFLLAWVSAVACLVLSLRADTSSASEPFRLVWAFGVWPTRVFFALCGAWIAWRVARASRQGSSRATYALLATALVVAAASHLLATACRDARPNVTRSIVCVDLASGRIRWSLPVLRAPRETLHADNTPATPTPAVCGERIYAYFGRGGLVCASVTGQRIWTSSAMPHESRYGAVSSPILCGEDVILTEEVMGKDTGRSFIARVRGTTGEVLWKKDRGIALHGRNAVHRTPILVEVGGREGVAVWGRHELIVYDAGSGAEICRTNLRTVALTDPIASVVSDRTRLFLAARDESLAVDIERAARGEEGIVWRRRVPGPGCASPVLADGRLFVVTEGGRVSCLDAGTGVVVWTRNLAGKYYASPVAAGGHVYFCNTEGRTTVFRSSGDSQPVAENDLGEKVFASFAVAPGSFLVRGDNHVYCIRPR